MTSQDKAKKLKLLLGEKAFNKEYYGIKDELKKNKNETNFSLIIDVMYIKHIAPQPNLND